MPPEKSDPAYLLDMLTYAEMAVALVEGMTYERYQADKVVQLAVERAIEIVGEAARRVSRDFQQQHPEVPWQPIVAQRHILAHEYGEVQADRIWRVATIHLPELVARLKPLTPDPPKTAED